MIDNKRFKQCKISKTYLLIASLVTASTLTAFQTNAMSSPPKLSPEKLDEVINALTIEEKAKLVRGTGMDIGDNGPAVGATKDKVPGAAGTTYSIERLGIPSIVLADGPAGVRISPTRDNDKKTYHATAFPIANLLSSTWDPQLIERVGQAIGNETKEYGIDVMLAPALNIHRYALGGRNFEYYSEDPLLSGKIAAAMVNGIQSQGVGTSLKHFVANNHEWNRNAIDVKVDERAFREIYLRGFEIAVKESSPWTIMSSYNKVNGEFTSESSRLLTDILREQWGFKGIVMTDWFGGTDAVKQMQAGNDLLMPGRGDQEAAIINAVSSGELDEKIIDRNVRNILNTVLKSPTFHQYEYSDKPNLKEHAKLAQITAEEGMVLLKNQNNALPFTSGVSLSVYGNHSFDVMIGGTGSGDVNEAYSVSLEDGLKAASIEYQKGLADAYKAHIKVEDAKRPISKSPFAEYLPKPPLNELTIDHKQLAASVEKYDAALITIGRSSGEFVDRKQSDYYLTQPEKDMIDSVSTAFRKAGKPVVVILNVGGLIETASWENKVDAILLAHQPGQEAGNAITNILLGKANPSGKLTDTWPIDLVDFPAHEGFPGKVLDPNAKPQGMMGSTASEVIYDDSIWVGYRYFNTKDKAVAYPFGHGLSYTNFAYTNIQLNSTEFTDSITAQVTVKNTGKVAGKEVVQLYLSAPQQQLIKPQEELRAFAKTKLLQPGETQVISLKLTSRDLTSFDEKRNLWIAEPGEYVVKASTSSRVILQSAKFSVNNEISIQP